VGLIEQVLPLNFRWKIHLSFLLLFPLKKLVMSRRPFLFSMMKKIIRKEPQAAKTKEIVSRTPFLFFFSQPTQYKKLPSFPSKKYLKQQFEEMNPTTDKKRDRLTFGVEFEFASATIPSALTPPLK
jgi:hypothetical protein